MPVTAVRAGLRRVPALTATAVLATLYCPAPASPVSYAAPRTHQTSAAGTARAKGAVRIFYTYAPDDEIRFTFDARAAPYSRPQPGLPRGMPTDARGSIDITHRMTHTGRTSRIKGDVDCLITGGRTATFTAVVTEATPDAADWIGKRSGISVLDSGRRGDRLGFSWAVDFETDAQGQAVQANVGTCMAPAPFAPVTDGGLAVHHAELPPPPPPRQAPAPRLADSPRRTAGGT
ncbi:hypothetical protein OG285_37760 (plasmid) [Streptomyces sp. NBC_01471]|uniref:hypothetical protein n=1 Tax=Streptomyces sp. NBC_01471 TaxID=2903879 RepID=UPI00325186DD